MPATAKSTAKPTALNARDLAAELGLTSWQLRLARADGMIPKADLDGRWSPELVRSCAERVPDVLAAYGDRPPIGAVRAAALLSTRAGIDVERADVETLVTRGVLQVIGNYRGKPLYLRHDLEELDDATVVEVVTARKGVLHDTVDGHGAARVLGWPKAVFDLIAARSGLTADQLGRYPLDRVRALAADPELSEQARQKAHAAALAKARRDENRHEETLRDWLQRCAAYLDRVTERPPDATQVARTLRALTTARRQAAEPPP
ncbi:hypothetical protein [Actinomadura kijaniata]|uniref:hypothetical protein n=1 Tax=Actinomadura kijaniata TaxID=46161 RepID=UPI000834D70B|nr:hypothetical protein [Actinomadura kijaniata]